MTDQTKIEMNVDPFSDGGRYFVRTEIEARSVSIQGPFPDLESALKLKAQLLANRDRTAETLRAQLLRATST